MSLLARILTPRAASPYKPWDDFWYNPAGFGSKSLSGMKVSAEGAMRMSVVFACIRIIAEAIASVPLLIYRRREDQGKDRATNHPLYFRLHNEPNEFQTSTEWREMMQGHVSLRGNAYCRIVPGARFNGDIQLIPLHPDRVLPVALPSGQVGYVYQPPEGARQTFTQNEIFHLRGLSSDGIIGLSPFDLLRESIGLAIASQAYAARFFEGNAAPGGFIKHPAKLGDIAHKRLMDWLKEHHQGVMNSHQPAIFEEGMDWVQVGIEPEKAQMILTQEFTVIDISRAWRVPLHLLNVLTKPSYASIEHQSLEFVTYDRMPDFVKWEQRIDKQLIVAKETFFAEFLLEGLLRGDIKTRYEAYSKAIQTGWMNRNEARIKENLNPVPELDKFLEPENMRPAGSNDADADGNGDRMARILNAAAGRIARREAGAIQKLAERAGGDARKFKDDVLTFYDSHAHFIAEVLCVGEEAANKYTLFQAKRMCQAVENGTVPHLLKELKDNGGEWILMMTREDKDHEEDAEELCESA